MTLTDWSADSNFSLFCPGFQNNKEVSEQVVGTYKLYHAQTQTAYEFNRKENRRNTIFLYFLFHNDSSSTYWNHIYSP